MSDEDSKRSSQPRHECKRLNCLPRGPKLYKDRLPANGLQLGCLICGIAVRDGRELSSLLSGPSGKPGICSPRTVGVADIITI